jgi:hypothetical protein
VLRSPTARVLDETDEPAVRALLATDPVAACVIAGRVEAAGTAAAARGFAFSGSPDAARPARERAAALVDALPDLAEADLNPVRCTAHGCVVLDMRLRFAQRPREARVKTW